MDRDGTINEEVGYVNHISRFCILPGAVEAVKALNEAGLRAVVVSNQSGVARGYFPESLVTQVNQSLCREMEIAGAVLDGIYYCPHLKEGRVEPYNIDCECRKPKAGMLRKAAADLDIDLSRSYVVGDRVNDVLFAHRGGLKGILTLSGYGRGEAEYVLPHSSVTPDFIAEDLSDAVRWILADLKNAAAG